MENEKDWMDYDDPFHYENLPNIASGWGSMWTARPMWRIFHSDMIEKEKEYKIHVDLPGIRADELDVHVKTEKFLVLRAERTHLHDKEKDTVHAMERSFGKIQRRLALPAEIDLDNVTSEFHNGVLTVTLPKLPVVDGKPKSEGKSVKVKEAK
mmetsp:Transcript_25933/g.43219  ORF Transcript_25933/g.43219 Transcript_25933/m.43219 type:complete len:153 (-) Transcript_25933:167-625(-)